VVRKALLEFPVRHTFLQIANGACIAFFEEPVEPFDFTQQRDFDLHIALQLDYPTLERMLEKSEANARHVDSGAIAPRDRRHPMTCGESQALAAFCRRRGDQRADYCPDGTEDSRVEEDDEGCGLGEPVRGLFPEEQPRKGSGDQRHPGRHRRNGQQRTRDSAPGQVPNDEPAHEGPKGPGMK
jgi:hypothetical protein